MTAEIILWNFNALKFRAMYQDMSAFRFFVKGKTVTCLYILIFQTIANNFTPAS